MPSFDIVSKVDLAEVDNALANMTREMSQRYDFKNSQSRIERNGSERGCHGGHHGRHAVRELHPNGIVGFDGALSREAGSAVTHDIREVLVGLVHGRVAQEFGDGCYAGGGPGVEKCGAGDGVGCAGDGGDESDSVL